jgi:undecaprenyl-phosphate galactose phosphotransferase
MIGLWQVSGRSRLSFTKRVRLDTRYLRNWSLWLDLRILARTFWVVIRGEGAY